MSSRREDKPPADLEAVRRTFEQFGRTDPLYAALSRRGRQHNRWDPEAFFETGRREIDSVLDRIAQLGVRPVAGRALDFGCAVGRLTQALGVHFAEAVGVDIAEAMVARAREYNQHGERVSYIVNTGPDLRVLADASFDFIYTNKVLQHIPPAHQATFIAEFVRLLRPGGVAVFQTRNGPLIRPATLRAWLYTLNRVHIRRLTQRLRRRPPYEMHYIARSLVEQVVTAAGGRMLAVDDLSAGRPNRSLRYIIEREPAPAP